MSDYAAIASVTQEIALRLGKAIHLAMAANVLVGPPTSTATAQPEPAEVDLFLYQVNPNGALRNNDLPSRRSDGTTLVQRPKAALDLHYLLTFRGKEVDAVPQRLMGLAIQTLHSEPFLLDQGDSPDVVKLTMQPMTLEEITKLWSVFFQMPYRLSIAYQASVVFIDGIEVPRQALPVLDRRLYVSPFRNPVIEAVSPADVPGTPITSGSIVVISGRQLQGDMTEVLLDGEAIGPTAVTKLTATEIRVDLGQIAVPRAGVRTVAVRHQKMMGSPLVPYGGLRSNVEPMVVCPELGALAPAAGKAAQAPTNNQPTATPAIPATVVVGVTPDVRVGQQARLMLNSTTDPALGFVYSNPPAVADSNQLTFSAEGAVQGTYFIRLDIDGAQSPPYPNLSPPWQTITIPPEIP